MTSILLNYFRTPFEIPKQKCISNLDFQVSNSIDFVAKDLQSVIVWCSIESSRSCAIVVKCVPLHIGTITHLKYHYNFICASMITWTFLIDILYGSHIRKHLYTVKSRVLMCVTI